GSGDVAVCFIFAAVFAQPISAPVNSHMAFGPAIQCIWSSDPKASILRSLYRAGYRISKTLISRNGGHRIFAKPVEPIRHGDPNIAFAIFEHAADVITRKPIHRAESINIRLVYVQ